MSFNDTHQDEDFQAVDLNVMDVSKERSTTTEGNNDSNPTSPPATASYSGPVEGTILETRQRGPSKFQSLKQWSQFQVKCTRQLVNEKLGRSSKTVDVDLETRIETLKDTQKKFGQLVYLSGQLIGNLQVVAETQRAMSENFAFLHVKAPELATEFQYSSKIQKEMSKQTGELIQAVVAFNQKIETLVNKTMDDTLTTIKNYEMTRLSYDATRTEVEKQDKSRPSTPAGQAKYEALVAQFEQEKQQFERLRKDVDIKLKLLNANKIQVLNQQLLWFNQSLLQYFGGSHKAMAPLLAEMKEKLEGITRDGSEFLEQIQDQPRDVDSLTNSDQ